MAKISITGETALSWIKVDADRAEVPSQDGHDIDQARTRNYNVTAPASPAVTANMKCLTTTAKNVL